MATLSLSKLGMIGFLSWVIRVYAAGPARTSISATKALVIGRYLSISDSGMKSW